MFTNSFSLVINCDEYILLKAIYPLTQKSKGSKFCKNYVKTKSAHFVSRFYAF